MEEQKKQIDWVNSMKAFLILAMVAGHSTSPLVTYIYLSHMPAFFLLSGYTYRGSRYTVSAFVRKKLLTILLPAVCINVLYIVIYSVMCEYPVYSYFTATEPLVFREWITGLFLRLQTTELGGATWFLFVLFEVQVIVRLLELAAQKLQCERIFLGLVLLAGGCGYVLVTKQIVLCYSLDLAFLACFYFGAGIWMARVHVFEHIDRNVMLPFCVIVTIFCGGGYFYGTLPMNWPTREFADPLIQCLSVFAAFYLVYCAAVSMRHVQCLQWLGNHTYCILVTHFAVFKVLFAAGACTGILSIQQLQQLTPDAQTASNGGWIFITVFTVLLCSAAAWLAEKNVWTDYVINARVWHKKKPGEDGHVR